MAAARGKGASGDGLGLVDLSNLDAAEATQGVLIYRAVARGRRRLIPGLHGLEVTTVVLTDFGRFTMRPGVGSKATNGGAVVVSFAISFTHRPELTGR